MSEGQNSHQGQDRPKQVSRLGLYVPLVIFALCLLAWSIYWFMGAQRLEAEIATQRATLVARGFQITAPPIRIDGYPYRFHARVAELKILSPSGRGVEMPRLEIEANAYAPKTWVFYAPEGLSVHRGMGADGGLASLGLKAQLLRGSLKLTKSGGFLAALEATQPEFSSSNPMHPTPFTKAERLEIYLRSGQVKDSLDGLLTLEGAHTLDGGAGKAVHIEGTVTAISALKDDNLSQWAEADGQVKQARVQIKSGPSEVLFKSESLRFDPLGRMNGDVVIETKDAANIPKALSDLGLAPAQKFKSVPLGSLQLTLSFKNGALYMGNFKVTPVSIVP